MVDTGLVHNAMGRVSAQRVGIVRFVGVVAVRSAHFWRSTHFGGDDCCAVLNSTLIPLYRATRGPRFRCGIAAEVLSYRATVSSARAEPNALGSGGLVALVIACAALALRCFYYQSMS